MNKFHQIPTDKFVPISHDNSYLFNHYDKIANFIAFNLNKNYKNILAKPAQNGYAFDWFSVYKDLYIIDSDSKSQSELGLMKYWEFIDVINMKIADLKNSNNEDKKNWASLLSKVFSHHDNFIFSNGVDISIVWGWKFDNNDLYKKNIRKDTDTLLVEDAELSHEDVADLVTIEPDAVIEEKNTTEEIEDDSYEKVDFSEKKINKPVEKAREKTSFKKFLQWFASHYWWLLWLLTLLIAMVFFFKIVA